MSVASSVRALWFNILIYAVIIPVKHGKWVQRAKQQAPYSMAVQSMAQRLLLMCSQVLKIVSRKEPARLQVSAPLTAAVVQHLNSPINSRIAAEAANVTLNMCYEERNVHLMVQQQGAHALVPHLASSAPQLQANAAGAIQSICFQKKGRACLRDADLVPKLLNLLGSEHAKVKARAVGALHNVSSDAEAIRAIRRCALNCLNVIKLQVVPWNGKVLRHGTSHEMQEVVCAVTAQSTEVRGRLCVGSPTLAGKNTFNLEGVRGRTEDNSCVARCSHKGNFSDICI
jgi:hypothetical protein